MSLSDDLKSEVATIFNSQWATRNGQKIPVSDDLKLGNDALSLDATVLYADLSGSTKLVDGYEPHFAAEIYKAYLHSAAKIIRDGKGAITSYDGDRIMAVFIGESKNTSAVRCALKINYAVKNIVSPAMKAQYNTTYEVTQTVGVDTSSLFVARTGIRGSNDLVWVGRAANYAAKLTELSSDYPVWITGAVHSKLHESVKLSNGNSIWEKRSWTPMNKLSIYRSNYWLEF